MKWMGWFLSCLLVGHGYAMQPPVRQVRGQYTGLTEQDIAVIKDLAARCLVLLVARSDGNDVELLLQKLYKEACQVCDECRTRLGHDLLRDEMELWDYQVRSRLYRFEEKTTNIMMIPELKLGLLVIIYEEEIDWQMIDECM